METIYLDSLFLQELVTDYLLLLCAGRLAGLTLKRGRYLMSALLGAAYSVLSFLPGLGFLSLPLMKLTAALLMGLAAFGAESRPLVCTGIFLAVSAAFGGLLLGLSLAGFRPALDTRTLFLAFALCYGLLSLLLERRGRAAQKPHATAELHLNGRSVSFRVLLDSGNCLFDPISGKSVLIASPVAVRELLGAGAAYGELEAADFVEAAAALPELRGKLRLIPYSTLSGSSMLAAFTPEKALIDGESRELLVGISTAARGEGFEGIL